MADWTQFEEGNDKREATGFTASSVACQVCEAMLPDAVDGALGEAEQRAFNRHVAGCVVCARELEEAQRGAAWLGMLKQQTPEPGPALLERILAQTTGTQTLGAQTTQAVSATAAAPAFVNPSAVARPVMAAPSGWENASLPTRLARKANWAVSAISVWQSVRETLSLQWMKPMLQPRMAMTAAMAFFSIALTLNLTGVRVSELNASSLRPSSLRRAVADRSASAVRSFQNMRVVYQAEAQVNDLRSNWQQEQQQESAPAPEPRQQKEAKPKHNPANPQGSSRLDFAPVDPHGAGMSRKGA